MSTRLGAAGLAVLPTGVTWRRLLGVAWLGGIGFTMSLFLAEPAHNGWASPAAVGTTTVRVEVFVDDPDAFVARAVAAGADGRLDPVRDHPAPWGTHRQGGFFDPFGHLWLVGDRSPLRRTQG